uniref:Uncharacterized protein n=1 Tax=Romanomermis culicivorax TaxID=13658 RepID=A0A915L893_ROMCU
MLTINMVEKRSIKDEKKRTEQLGQKRPLDDDNTKRMVMKAASGRIAHFYKKGQRFNKNQALRSKYWLVNSIRVPRLIERCEAPPRHLNLNK